MKKHKVPITLLLLAAFIISAVWFLPGRADAGLALNRITDNYNDWNDGTNPGPVWVTFNLSEPVSAKYMRILVYAIPPNAADPAMNIDEVGLYNGATKLTGLTAQFSSSIPPYHGWAGVGANRSDNYTFGPSAGYLFDEDHYTGWRTTYTYNRTTGICTSAKGFEGIKIGNITQPVTKIRFDFLALYTRENPMDFEIQWSNDDAADVSDPKGSSRWFGVDILNDHSTEYAYKSDGSRCGVVEGNALKEVYNPVAPVINSADTSSNSYVELNVTVSDMDYLQELLLERSADNANFSPAAFTVVSAGGGVMVIRDSNVQGNCMYYYRAKAEYNAGETSPWSNVKEAALNLEPPVISDAVLSDGSVYLTVNLPGVQGYHSCLVERRKSTGDWVAVPVTETLNGNVVTLRDIDIDRDSQYLYRVKSKYGADGGITTAFSNERAVSVGYSASNVIKDIKATAGNCSAEVTWNPVAGAGKYYLQRSSGGAWEAATELTATSHTVAGLTPGATYRFRVKPDNGMYSLPVRIKVPAEPMKPSVDVETSGGRATLTMTCPTPGVTYRIERAESLDGDYTLLADNLSAGDYEETGLAKNAKYWYKVTAIKGAALSEPQIKAMRVR
ncbi:MAG: fibronectin type III domain-containing protein [Dehalococcoidia bacterium]|nr:MAG: fibronectin type III domain-containing protein [Dehalococcoidia bacterium]